VKRRFRLTGTADFRRVRHSGKTYAHPLIVLVVLPNELDISRFAVSAGRSIGNAVQRNRAKRVIRSALAIYTEKVNSGWDIIILARRAISKAKFLEISRALYGLFKSAQLINGNQR
jgi:ribonuclease P protein component